MSEERKGYPVEIGPLNLSPVFRSGRLEIDDGFVPGEAESQRAGRFWAEATENGTRKLNNMDHMHLTARIMHPQRYAEALRKYVSLEDDLELRDLLLEAHAEFWKRRVPAA